MMIMMNIGKWPISKFNFRLENIRSLIMSAGLKLQIPQVPIDKNKYSILKKFCNTERLLELNRGYFAIHFMRKSLSFFFDKIELIIRLQTKTSLFQVNTTNSDFIFILD